MEWPTTTYDGVDRHDGSITQAASTEFVVRDAIGFVELVQVLRRTGMSVAEVRAFVQLGTEGLGHHRSRIALLERHASTLEQQMAQLREGHATVQKAIAYFRDMVARGLGCEARLAQEQGAGTDAAGQNPA